MRVECWCGEYFDTIQDIDKLTFYKVKFPTIKHTPKNEKIIEEVFYYYFCPKCERDVVLIKRKALNALGNRKALIPEKLVGKAASEYLEKTKENRINKTNELRYISKPYSKVIDLSYYKTLNGTTQRPRYLNETGFSGAKVESEVLILDYVRKY